MSKRLILNENLIYFGADENSPEYVYSQWQHKHYNHNQRSQIENCHFLFGLRGLSGFAYTSNIYTRIYTVNTFHIFGNFGGHQLIFFSIRILPASLQHLDVGEYACEMFSELPPKLATLTTHHKMSGLGELPDTLRYFNIRKWSSEILTPLPPNITHIKLGQRQRNSIGLYSDSKTLLQKRKVFGFPN